MTINLTLTDVTPQNRRVKMLKAVRALSQRLGVPVSVEGRKKQHNHTGEPFLFRAHEELIYKWYNHFSAVVNDTYNLVVSHFGLPEVRVLSKAAADVLRHRGKIVYSPETGDPIKQRDWDGFVTLLEKFLNRKMKDTDKKIILDSKALGRILNRMLKYNRLDDVKAIGLDDIKYRGKTFDWISDNVKNMRSVMGEELSRSEMARIQVLQMSAASKITGVSDKLRSDIKQILIEGVAARKSKGQISQDLFDKMTGRNRDFQMIADTEIQNAINNASLLDEVHSAEPGEKVYFQRVEVIDQNTCNFCKKMHGTVVLWSDHPLPSDKINDPIASYAIWDGKNWDGKKEMVANGAYHPYCRGIWVRYNSTVDALLAHLQNDSEQYNRALDQAREEYREKGINNPNDKTPGFVDRIQDYYGPKPGKEQRDKFATAFNQARKEFAGDGITHPTGKTPGFHDRILDIYNGLMGKAYNPNQARDAIGRWAADGGGSGNREPWYSSTDKAKELKAEDWGTPEEIAEMAKMKRIAASYGEARKIMESMVNKPLRSKSGLLASISKKSIDKILSGDAVKESVDIKAHLLASANIDILFSNAIEKWIFQSNPNRNNQGLQERKYLYSPMEYSGQIIPVKFTVKQFIDTEKGNRIYSLEAIDIEIKKERDTGILAAGVVDKSTALGSPRYPHIGRWSMGDGVLFGKSSLSAPARHPSTINIAYLFDSVNEYLQENTVTKRVFKALHGGDELPSHNKVLCKDNHGSMIKSFSERAREALGRGI